MLLKLLPMIFIPFVAYFLTKIDGFEKEIILPLDFENFVYGLILVLLFFQLFLKIDTYPAIYFFETILSFSWLNKLY